MFLYVGRGLGVFAGTKSPAALWLYASYREDLSLFAGEAGET